MPGSFALKGQKTEDYDASPRPGVERQLPYLARNDQVPLSTATKTEPDATETHEQRLPGRPRRPRPTTTTRALGHGQAPQQWTYRADDHAKHTRTIQPEWTQPQDRGPTRCGTTYPQPIGPTFHNWRISSSNDSLSLHFELPIQAGPRDAEHTRNRRAVFAGIECTLRSTDHVVIEQRPGEHQGTKLIKGCHWPATQRPSRRSSSSSRLSRGSDSLPATSRP